VIKETVPSGQYNTDPKMDHALPIPPTTKSGYQMESIKENVWMNPEQIVAHMAPDTCIEGSNKEG